MGRSDPALFTLLGPVLSGVHQSHTHPGQGDRRRPNAIHLTPHDITPWPPLSRPLSCCRSCLVPFLLFFLLSFLFSMKPTRTLLAGCAVASQHMRRCRRSRLTVCGAAPYDTRPRWGRRVDVDGIITAMCSCGVGCSPFQPWVVTILFMNGIIIIHHPSIFCPSVVASSSSSPSS